VEKTPLLVKVTDLNCEKPALTVLLLLQPPEDLEVAEVELEDAGVEPVLEALLLIWSKSGLLISSFVFCRIFWFVR
jgi:hypothetical protein